jgi:flagellar motor switch protein FliM
MDDVQPFVFGRGDTGAPVMLSGLDRLGDKLCRRMCALVEPLAGCKPGITSSSVEMIEFGQWAGTVPATSSISVFRLAPLKGNVILRIDAAMICTLVERFYGGSGDRPHVPRGEFTPTEDRLIGRLAESIMTGLVACWAETMPLEMSFVARETGVGFAAGAQPGDPMALQRFHVSLTKTEQWPVDVLLPIVALRGVEPLLGTKVHDQGSEDDPVWRNRIARQMENIRLPARTVLARPSLSLAELLQLKPGDVIPVTISRSLPLIVGDRVVAHGSIGEQDGRAAFMIEKLD